MGKLGRLTKVDLRTVWQTEDRHFTPWLAEESNLCLLGDAIGIALELEAQEKSVGPFRADILCKDLDTDNWVLIENQVERTDHRHLGQLITYAAGLRAVTIVWIATPFTEEHRAALDWLNEITDSRFNFFGLEVELWRIGESEAAPKFNVVAKPNDWSKTVAEGVARVEREALSETKQLQLEFWMAFRDFLNDRNGRIQASRIPRPQNWMNFSLGRSGFKLSAIASTWNTKFESYDKDEIRAQFEAYGDDAGRYFDLIADQKEEIELELAERLEWYRTEDEKWCKAFWRKTVDLSDRGRWDEQMTWLADNLEALNSTFANRIKALSLDD